eukprot:1643825-Rhodomonas_salina.2
MRVGQKEKKKRSPGSQVETPATPRHSQSWQIAGAMQRIDGSTSLQASRVRCGHARVTKVRLAGDALGVEGEGVAEAPGPGSGGRGGPARGKFHRGRALAALPLADVPCQEVLRHRLLAIKSGPGQKRSHF